MPEADISIVVPCWGADAVPAEVAARWLDSGVVREVIVALAPGGGAGDDDNAGGADPADDDARPAGLHVHRCTRAGRGHQMNEGAAQARGSVLLFHHADTELEAAHLHALAAAVGANPALGGGAFVRRFDERHPRLRWVEWWEAWRCRRFGPLFGDQSVFVRRTAFGALGGYADIPLMEDVEFTLRLRRRFPVALLEPAIRSSPRKHLAQGRWRTTGSNALFLALFTLGCSPERLHAWYYRRGARKTREKTRQEKT